MDAKKLGKQLATPMVCADGYGATITGGLTKREAFALAAMPGCVNRWSDGGSAHADMAAKHATEYADALLAELAKEA